MKPNIEHLLLERSAKIRRLKGDNARYFGQTIIRLIELETIAEDSTSEKSKEIIAKYRERIDRRKEQDLAEQN